jgi:hypothetical protein
MKDLTKAKTFEKVRRWSLVVAIASIAVLVILTVLESWGAISFTNSSLLDDYGYYPGEPSFWGKLQETLGIITGFAFAVILMVLFVLPRKKN